MDIKEILLTRLLNFPWERLIPRRTGIKEQKELLFALRDASMGEKQNHQSMHPTQTTQKTEYPPQGEDVEVQKTNSLQLPTTEETIVELKRRLAKELYRMELDLQGGGRIFSKPCDCLSKKHHLGIEATAEELMSYEANPIYGQVIEWLNTHSVEFEPEEIAKKPPEYYQGLTPEVRAFRKGVMGTENVRAMLSDEEMAKVMKRVTEELEKEE